MGKKTNSCFETMVMDFGLCELRALRLELRVPPESTVVKIQLLITIHPI